MKKTYTEGQVSMDEKLARIVLSPRDIDPVTKYPKDSFITLRQDEEGISFLRFDYMGEDKFLKSGEERAALYNKKLKKPKYSFAGWMESPAGKIIALAPNIISIEVNDPDNKPEHVNVLFKKENVIVKGIVTDAEILDILDELFLLLHFNTTTTQTMTVSYYN